MQQAPDSSATTEAEAPPPSVWEHLADRLNPAFERPKLVEGTEARLLTTSRGQEYYIVKNPKTGTYVRLAPDEYYLLGLMDGTRQVKDLVLAYFLQYKSFAFQRIAHVVAQLRHQRFLTEEPRDVWFGLTYHFAKQTWTYRVDRLIKSFKYHEFGLEGIDGAITQIYRAMGWIFFKRPVLILWILASIVGVVLFAWLQSGGGPAELHESGALNVLHVGGSYASGLIALLALYIFLVSVHELGHAMATKFFGREVPRGGVMIYYGGPAFFMDTTDIWLEPRRARMIVSAAGMMAVWGVGGLAMLYVMLQPTSPLVPLAYAFAFVAFISNSMQLIPLLELDGYFLLMDWLELPLLRPRALAFVRGELWRKLQAREKFNREERIFAIYGTLALVYSVWAIGFAIWIWERKLGRVVEEALEGDSLLWKTVVLLLVLMFAIPLAFGISLKLRQLFQSARGGVVRLRHRSEEARAQARLEARELVGTMRFLSHLPFPQREAIVTELQLQKLRQGDYVVRQGEPGEHFYVIRKGQAEVVQVDAEGWPRELAVLRRGDSFGELALLYNQPRSASVRALTPLEVYALTREAFETTVAQQLRDYGVTLERIEERSELARMSLFRHAAPSELEPILDALETHEFPAGATIITQGEPGDRFYLIRRGRVEISRRRDDGSEQVLGDLGVGEFFGEMALLSDAPRTATVRAVEPVVTWSLDKTRFSELLLNQFQLGGALSSEVEQREETQRRLMGERTA